MADAIIALLIAQLNGGPTGDPTGADRAGPLVERGTTKPAD